MTARELQVERLNRGFSIRAFADEVGVSPFVIGQLERGESVHPANAKIVADYFGITVVELLPSDDDRGPVAA